MYRYGLIGNCQVAALVSELGSADWFCLPRPDSPPVFGRLLDPQGGHFSVSMTGEHDASQGYLANSNVLVTRLVSKDGSEVRITDFCPRFMQHGRIFRPAALFRVVEPVSGSPSIQVSCRPVDGWSKRAVAPERGNSHLRFDLGTDKLRLTTNMPLTYLLDETPFVLTGPQYFGLTWNWAIEEDLVQLSQRFLEQTVEYWRTWVKHCSIPSSYQKETIRSALVLKLHCYEDTGAILAALTTSLPEEKGGSRNWDYRFCWLRDAAFALSAFRNLGHFEEMEGFLRFLLNIAHKHEHSRDRLRPVYRLDQTLPLPEEEHAGWAGFDGGRPVRSGNQAADHVQNDVYGEMILTLAPIFFDERFTHLRTREHEDLLKNLARFSARSVSQPDAGLWELRSGWQEHSFTNLMCWAGIDRLMRIRDTGQLGDLELDLAAERTRALAAIEGAAREGSIRNGPKDPSFDAGLLLLPIVRYPDLEACRRTVLDAARALTFEHGGNGRPTFLYRYARKDDFGKPKAAFLICSFWLVQALARIGETQAAAETMAGAMRAANTLGLFSEHFLPAEMRQCGNFPQAYSHVGQINAAFSISRPWEEIT